MKTHIKSKKKAMEIAMSALISINLTAYSISKITAIYNRNFPLLMISISSLLLMLIHIITVCYSKKSNIIRTISYAVIVPEITLAIEMMKWQPLIAVTEFLIIVILSLILLIKRNQVTARKLKKIINFINFQIIVSSVILIPSFIFMMSLFENYEPIATIEMYESPKSATENFSISEATWKEMTIEEKSEIISTLVNIESNKLGLKTIPKIKIVFLPGPIYGTTSENILIKLNASRISYGSAADVVDTVSHEF